MINTVEADSTRDTIHELYPQDPPKNVVAADVVKRFIFPLNDAVDVDGVEGTVTNHIVGVTTQSRRANKRSLCKYLKDYHKIPDSQHKTILKAMGFWGMALGTKP